MVNTSRQNIKKAINMDLGLHLRNSCIYLEKRLGSLKVVINLYNLVMLFVINSLKDFRLKKNRSGLKMAVIFSLGAAAAKPVPAHPMAPHRNPIQKVAKYPNSCDEAWPLSV